jgi:hypothetical protein
VAADAGDVDAGSAGAWTGACSRSERARLWGQRRLWSCVVRRRKGKQRGFFWQNAFAFRQGSIVATTAVLLLAVTAVFIFLQFRSSCVASSPEPSSRNGRVGPT